MSELKAFRIIQGDTGGYGVPSYKCDTDGNRLEEWRDICEVYDKSEADKVVTGLEAENAQLKKRSSCTFSDDCLRVRQLKAEVRKLKYKRCLAIASKIKLRARWFGDNVFYKKELWALQWHRRWPGLAEKFKEVK